MGQSFEKKKSVIEQGEGVCEGSGDTGPYVVQEGT